MEAHDWLRPPLKGISLLFSKQGTRNAFVKYSSTPDNEANGVTSVICVLGSSGQVVKSGHRKLPPSHHERQEVQEQPRRCKGDLLGCCGGGCFCLIYSVLSILSYKDEDSSHGKHVFTFILWRRLSYLIVSLCKQPTRSERRYFPKAKASSCCLLSHQLGANGNEFEWIGST